MYLHKVGIITVNKIKGRKDEPIIMVLIVIHYFHKSYLRDSNFSNLFLKENFSHLHINGGTTNTIRTRSLSACGLDLYSYTEQVLYILTISFFRE